MRLDSDVIAWLKADGRGYQTEANWLLRHAMLHYTRGKVLAGVKAPAGRPRNRKERLDHPEPVPPAGANSKSKCECREGGSRVKDVPILLIACGRDNVANNAGGPGHRAEPIFFLCFRGRRHNLGDGLAKLGDADGPAGLADALEEREAGRLKFRDRYFVHNTSSVYHSQGP
jgi:hypothetical protein